MLVKTHVIDEIGLLDQVLSAYWEDHDWCVRGKYAWSHQFTFRALEYGKRFCCQCREGKSLFHVKSFRVYEDFLLG